MYVIPQTVLFCKIVHTGKSSIIKKFLKAHGNYSFHLMTGTSRLFFNDRVPMGRSGDEKIKKISWGQEV